MPGNILVRSSFSSSSLLPSFLRGCPLPLSCPSLRTPPGTGSMLMMTQWSCRPFGPLSRTPVLLRVWVLRALGPVLRSGRPYTPLYQLAPLRGRLLRDLNRWGLCHRRPPIGPPPFVVLAPPWPHPVVPVSPVFLLILLRSWTGGALAACVDLDE